MKKFIILLVMSLILSCSSKKQNNVKIVSQGLYREIESFIDFLETKTNSSIKKISVIINESNEAIYEVALINHKPKTCNGLIGTTWFDENYEIYFYSKVANYSRLIEKSKEYRCKSVETSIDVDTSNNMVPVPLHYPERYLKYFEGDSIEIINLSP